jgi:hypothetical protein|tara:strand:- start:1900 stop:2103 length:204 start_codon:yes stop_codon:yes gene_type:complete
MRLTNQQFKEALERIILGLKKKNKEPVEDYELEDRRHKEYLENGLDEEVCNTEQLEEIQKFLEDETI